MGFGCRNVAYFVVLTLFILDIISFAASRNQNQEISSSQDQYSNDQFFVKNHNFPEENNNNNEGLVFRKKRSSPSPTFLEAELDKINIVSINQPITLDVNNYSKRMINNYINSGPNSIYQFQAEEENVRLRIYIEKYEIEDYKNDWLTGYNGLAESSGSASNNKGKSSSSSSSTDQIDLKNLENLDVLFTTRVERRLSRQVDPLEGVTSFTTDDNKLTLLFRHNNEDIHESSFRLHISTDHDTITDSITSQKGGFSRPGRQLSDPFDGLSSINSAKGNSFSLCSNNNNNQNRIIQAIEGTISTSRQFGLKTESDTEANKNCVQNLVSKTNGRFRFEFPKEIFIGGRDSNVNGKCEDDEPYLEIFDNVDGTKTRLCGRAGPETSYEFSGDLSLTYFTGSWKQEVFGFSFKYVTLCMGVVSMEVCDAEKIRKINQNQSKTEDDDNSEKNAEALENQTSNLKNRDDLIISTQDALQMIASALTGDDDSSQVVDDYGDVIEEKVNSSNSNQSQEEDSNSSSSTTTTTNQNPIRGNFGQNLMHTTMAAIGILMLLILAAAGYMACQKSREQDNMIKDLTEKLTLTESSINSLMNSTIIVRKKQSSEDTGLMVDSSSSMISISNENTKPCIINIDDHQNAQMHQNENTIILSNLDISSQCSGQLEAQKYKLGSSSSSTESKL